MTTSNLEQFYTEAGLFYTPDEMIEQLCTKFSQFCAHPDYFKRVYDKSCDGNVGVVYLVPESKANSTIEQLSERLKMLPVEIESMNVVLIGVKLQHGVDFNAYAYGSNTSNTVIYTE